MIRKEDSTEILKIVQETHAHPDTMDIKTFTNFIGNELIRKFKLFDAILVKEGLNNEFLILHQMWNYFGKPDNEDNAIETVNMEVMEYKNEEHSSELEEASTRSEALVELKEPGPSKNIQSDAKLSKITGDCETSDPFSIFIHTPGGRSEPKTRPLHVNSTDIAKDDDLFMCHLCYKEESDDGADSEDFDENEEEGGLEIDQNKNDNDLNDTNSDEKKKTDENEEEMNYSLCINCAKYY
ncbi:unnamed protein product [Ceutorhynchus assimilis]|uniref:Uncharacterized protein n=1 Tax=Ceutorhynchus assimilis TaxID=467358 RepID=A0A9N9MD87_9CUCU|nr:unnamed protein product [Ceutorhynchus assimilis]